jgi:hypothetical protein
MISNRQVRYLVLHCPLQQELWRMVAIRKMTVAMKVYLHFSMLLRRLRIMIGGPGSQALCPKRPA